MERFRGLFNLVVIFLKISLIESLVVLTTQIWKLLLLVKSESTSTNLVHELVYIVVIIVQFSSIDKKNSDHLIKSVIQETTVEAFLKLFEEMQKVWGYEPDATGNPIKV